MSVLTANPLSIIYAATASRQKILLQCPASTFKKGTQQSSVQGEVNSEGIASVVAYKILKGEPRVTPANPSDETRIMAFSTEEVRLQGTGPASCT